MANPAVIREIHRKYGITTPDEGPAGFHREFQPEEMQSGVGYQHQKGWNVQQTVEFLLDEGYQLEDLGAGWLRGKMTNAAMPKIPPPRAAQKGKRWPRASLAARDMQQSQVQMSPAYQAEMQRALAENNIPMQPQVQTPNSATLIDDVTGQPLLQTGDNPQGAETITVTPPGGNVPSAAGGGYATVGGGNSDPYAEREKQLARRRLEQTQGMIAAKRNVGDIAATARANYLDSSEDWKNTALGVAQPQALRLSRGATLPYDPALRAANRTQADYLSEEYSDENALASAQLNLDRLNRTSSGGYRTSGGGGGGGGGGGSSPYVDMRPPVPFGTPRPVGRPTLPVDDREEEAVDPYAAQKAQGLVPWRDPQNPGPVEWITPYEKSLRDARSSRSRDTQLQQERGKEISEGEISEAVRLNASDSRRGMPPDDAINLLISRGYTARDAKTIVDNAKGMPKFTGYTEKFENIGQEVDPNARGPITPDAGVTEEEVLDELAAALFKQPFFMLTPEQQEEVLAMAEDVGSTNAGVQFR